MLVGQCNVRTVKQCLVILRKKVGQYVHSCEQDIHIPSALWCNLKLAEWR